MISRYSWVSSFTRALLGALMALVIGFIGAMIPTEAKAESGNVRTLKREILKLAETYRGQDDPKGDKQDRLNQKISRLLQEAPQAPTDDRSADLVGAWEQVWGPYDYSNKGKLEINPDYAYQVLHADGYYYNITRSHMRGKKITAFLRGEYVANGEQVDVRFTRNIFYVNGWVPTGTSMYDLAALAESGVINGPDIPVPEGRGPKGREGRLREVYVDHDLRITYGSQPGNDPSYGDLYVLKRVEGSKFRAALIH
jgi:hypothetical protein